MSKKTIQKSKRVKTENAQPDRWHHHEAMDRASVILSHWNSDVTTHPFVLKHRELTAACEVAENAMRKAYQITALVGRSARRAPR